jgi:tetratricopeptide (TPR) repeat protein
MIVPVAIGLMLVLAITLVDPGPLHAQAGQGWIGKRVVQKSSNFALRNDNRSVVRMGTDLHFFRVERMDRVAQRLWLKAEGKGTGGWAPISQLVPVDQAIEFFTARIQARPTDTYSYGMRAALWRDRNELDRALSDLNELIRLSPKSAAGYISRGAIWEIKGDYDKAIADYNAAIRVDPRSTIAYYGRGGAWRHRDESGKAIADYNAAIRRDLQPRQWPGHQGRRCARSPPLVGHPAGRRPGRSRAGPAGRPAVPRRRREQAPRRDRLGTEPHDRADLGRHAGVLPADEC